jgi:hypothetical protein
MMSDRPERPTSAPTTPPPNEGVRRPAQAALPIGVRDGDVLIIGASDIDMSQAAELSVSLRAEVGLYIRVVFVPGGSGVTVLRPER